MLRAIKITTENSCIGHKYKVDTIEFEVDKVASVDTC